MSTSLLVLEFPGTSITGDCSIAGFQGHISLESFSWGLKAVSRIQPGQKKALISVKFDRLQLSKVFDSASIPMSNFMCNDTQFSKAILKLIDPLTESLKPGGGFSKFESIMEMELMKGYIEDISVRVSESGKAISVTEDVVLSFEKVVLNYYSYDAAKGTRIGMPSFESEQPAV